MGTDITGGLRKEKPMMLLIGIDRSPSKHDVCIMDVKGCQLVHLSIPNSAPGFEQLHSTCQKLEVPPQDCLVAIESDHSLLVDYLLDHGYPVYVIPGKAVDRYRDRHRQSRSCSDAGDAEVLAHVLRSDRELHRPWVADTPLTRQIRSQVKVVLNLTQNVVRFSNQLRDLLWRYYPIAADLFSSLDRYIALQFIQAYPTPQAGKALTQADFTTFCRTHNYRRSDYIARRYAQLSSAQTYASSEVAAAYASQAQTLARILHSLVSERDAAQRALTRSFEQHPDAFIYASLPGAGELLAPALLSKFRDHRDRFPSPAVAQAVAGTCPVTIESGKRKKRIQFRRACDHKFRYFATQFARCSIKEAPWAAAYFHTVLPRCDKVTQAYRCLANRWVAIIWRLWTDRIEYDEAVHLRNRLTNRRA
jgi:transposase